MNNYTEFEFSIDEKAVREAQERKQQRREMIDKVAVPAFLMSVLTSINYNCDYNNFEEDD